MVSSEYQVAKGEWFFLEDSAPALPSKISVVREHDPPVKKLSQTPNKFGA